MEELRQTTYWETSFVEHKRNKFGKGVTDPSSLKRSPRRKLQSAEGRIEQQEPGISKDGVNRNRMIASNLVRQQPQSRNLNTRAHIRKKPLMAPLLGRIDFSRSDNPGDIEHLKHGMYSPPNFDEANVLGSKGLAEHSESSQAHRVVRTTKSRLPMRCVTPDPIAQRGETTTRKTPQRAPSPLVGSTSALPTMPLTIEQEVRIRSRTVNSICRDIERRRQAARRNLSIRELSERVHNQANASMSREVEMRSRLQQNWNLALDRCTPYVSTIPPKEGDSKWTSSAISADLDDEPVEFFLSDDDDLHGLKYVREDAPGDEPLYLRYLRAKQYH